MIVVVVEDVTVALGGGSGILAANKVRLILCTYLMHWGLADPKRRHAPRRPPNGRHPN